VAIFEDLNSKGLINGLKMAFGFSKNNYGKKKNGHFQVSCKDPTLGFCKHIGIIMQIGDRELLDCGQHWDFV
jgi:hypothetical protein